MTLDQEQRQALAKTGKCACMSCGAIVPFSESLVLATANEVIASFCLGCFQPGRGLVVTRTAQGFTLEATGAAVEPAKIIMPDAVSGPGLFQRG